LCEEVLFNQVETVQGEHTSSTGRDNVAGRIKISQVSLEAQSIGVRYPKHKGRLDLYADEKYLMMGKLKYPTMFGNRKRMGFMELYIVHRINQRMNLAKGTT